jgi:hypothetical protein
MGTTQRREFLSADRLLVYQAGVRSMTLINSKFDDNDIDDCEPIV